MASPSPNSMGPPGPNHQPPPPTQPQQQQQQQQHQQQQPPQVQQQQPPTAPQPLPPQNYSPGQSGAPASPNMQQGTQTFPPPGIQVDSNFNYLVHDHLGIQLIVKCFH